MKALNLHLYFVTNSVDNIEKTEYILKIFQVNELVPESLEMTNKFIRFLNYIVFLITLMRYLRNLTHLYQLACAKIGFTLCFA